MFVSTEERGWDEEEDDIHVWGVEPGPPLQVSGGLSQAFAADRGLQNPDRDRDSAWARNCKAPRRALLICLRLGSRPGPPGCAVSGTAAPQQPAAGFPEQLPGEGAPRAPPAPPLVLEARVVRPHWPRRSPRPRGGGAASAAVVPESPAPPAPPSARGPARGSAGPQLPQGPALGGGVAGEGEAGGGAAQGMQWGRSALLLTRSCREPARAAPASGRVRTSGPGACRPPGAVPSRRRLGRPPLPRPEGPAGRAAGRGQHAPGGPAGRRRAGGGGRGAAAAHPELPPERRRGPGEPRAGGAGTPGRTPAAAAAAAGPRPGAGRAGASPRGVGGAERRGPDPEPSRPGRVCEPRLGAGLGLATLVGRRQ